MMHYYLRIVGLLLCTQSFCVWYYPLNFTTCFITYISVINQVVIFSGVYSSYILRINASKNPHSIHVVLEVNTHMLYVTPVNRFLRDAQYFIMRCTEGVLTITTGRRGYYSPERY